MNILKKLTLIFISILVLALIFMLVYTGRMSKRALPDYNEELSIEGLSGEVAVYRDEMGIPHIYAKNETDLYKVTGYIMAQERMWQMDLLRRVTLGRLSEIFGSDFVDTDLLLRSLEYSKKSHELLSSADEATTEALNAFSEGVNFYIDRNQGKYPFEFSLLGYQPEKWEAYHSLNLIGYMAWDLKSGWSELVLEEIAARVDSAKIHMLLPDLTKPNTYVIQPGAAELLSENSLQHMSKLDDLGLDILSGSNTWAIAGARSETGSPLLANDMHLTLNIPGIWLQVHQVVENKLNVSGLALPGQPFIIVGHNDSIAWGMTNTYVDNLDFYEEKINPDDSSEYLFKEQWYKFKVVEERIYAKGGEVYDRVNRFTHRGPVVSNFKKISDRVLTLRWVGQEESDEIRAIYKVNRASNWEEFKDAFRSFRSISQNIAYADVNGNIGLYCCAGVPLRKRDKLYAILPGWTDEYDWQGMIPFEDLPYEYNPLRGYVSAANNRAVGDTYPHHIGIWYAQPYRIDRIRELLSADEKITVADFKEIQNDKVSTYSKLFMEVMLPSMAHAKDLNELEQQALQILQNWNFSLNENFAGASISEFWTTHFIKSCFMDEMGEDLFKKFTEVKSLYRSGLYNILHDTNSSWFDNVLTEEKEGIAEISLESFRSAVAELVSQYGTDTADWKWGNLHALTLQHPLAKVDALNKVFRLNRGPYPVGGSFHTVSPYTYSLFQPADINHGSSHRSIYNLSAWDSSCSVIPTGNSGLPASEFYCNQTRLYVKGEYHNDWYSNESIKKQARYKALYRP